MLLKFTNRFDDAADRSGVFVGGVAEHNQLLYGFSTPLVSFHSFIYFQFFRLLNQYTVC